MDQNIMMYRRNIEWISIVWNNGIKQNVPEYCEQLMEICSMKYLILEPVVL